MKIRKQLLLDAADAADIEEDYLRWDYSGRGMYGRSCFGIVGRMADYSRFLVALATEGEEGHDVAWELTDRVSTDNMAYDTIFYFPGAQIEDE